MAVASLVLGVIAIILTFVPIIRIFAFLPAILSIVFAIIEFVSKKQDKRKSDAIVGIILSLVSLIVLAFRVFFIILFTLIASGNFCQMIFEEFDDSFHPYIYEEHYTFEDYEDIKDFDSFIYKDLI